MHLSRSGCPVLCALLATFCLTLVPQAYGAQETATDTKAAAKPAATRLPPARQFYLGRKIAQTMHYKGAQWLIRDQREREERCSLVLEQLGVRTGMTVCDMGCGNGFYSLKLARLVGPNGRVFAVDIQPQMLFMLRARAEEDGIENITPLLASVHDPRLPRASTDLILLVDVYHELSHPERVLGALRRALKPKGLVVLVEYRDEDPKVPIRPLHKMSKRQIIRELDANGFKLARQFDGLPWQHMMFFARDPQWAPRDTP